MDDSERCYISKMFFSRALKVFSGDDFVGFSLLLMISYTFSLTKRRDLSCSHVVPGIYLWANSHFVFSLLFIDVWRSLFRGVFDECSFAWCFDYEPVSLDVSELVITRIYARDRSRAMLFWFVR